MRYEISERLYQKELQDLANAQGSKNYFMIMTLFSSLFALELHLLGGVIDIAYDEDDMLIVTVQTTTSFITTSNRYEINPPSNILNKWVENYDIAGGNFGDVSLNITKSNVQDHINLQRVVASIQTVQCFAINALFDNRIKLSLLEKFCYIYNKVYNSTISSVRTQLLKKELLAKKTSISRELLFSNISLQSVRLLIISIVILVTVYKQRNEISKKSFLCILFVLRVIQKIYDSLKRVSTIINHSSLILCSNLKRISSLYRIENDFILSVSMYLFCSYIQNHTAVIINTSLMRTMDTCMHSRWKYG